jgi:hypothetical protein
LKFGKITAVFHGNLLTSSSMQIFFQIADFYYTQYFHHWIKKHMAGFEVNQSHAVHLKHTTYHLLPLIISAHAEEIQISTVCAKEKRN